MLKFIVLTVLLAFIPGFAPAKTYESEGQKFNFEVLLQQDDVIWGFDFLPDARIIFTERQGRMRIYDPKTKSVTNLKGIPSVWAKGQGGLLDVRVQGGAKPKIYWAYSEPVDKLAATAVAVADLEGQELKNIKKLFTAHEPSDQTIHFGSRIEFSGTGQIFITSGERNARPHALDLGYHTGKIIRLNEDGSVPKDNPFVGKPGAKPEIWSIGHRSPQGLVLNKKTGDLWMAEMGPRGGDELNLVKKGVNYGWPEVTYGREYYGIGIGVKSKAGVEEPVAYWVPSISPSGIAFYTGDKFPKWKDNLFIGTLSGQHLRRLVMEGAKVAKQEELLKDLDLRFRNVRTGPDGYLYLSTDDGKIARLVPVRE